MPMHADEIEVPETLVRALVDRQFPRVGGAAAAPGVRVRDRPQAVPAGRGAPGPVAGVRRTRPTRRVSDATWLPRLAPHLPVAVPVPVALGEPDPRLPLHLVGRAVAARRATRGRQDRQSGARDRPGRVRPRTALRGHGRRAAAQWHRTGNAAGPGVGGGGAIVEHGDLIDVDRARAVWQAALDAGPWPGPDVWIHGDLLGGNLLVRDGRLSAVIDWGPLKVADPAPDVAPAWTLLEGEAAPYLPGPAGRGRRHVGPGAGMGDAACPGRHPLLRRRRCRRSPSVPGGISTRCSGMSTSKPLGDAQGGCAGRDPPQPDRLTLSRLAAWPCPTSLPRSSASSGCSSRSR